MLNEKSSINLSLLLFFLTSVPSSLIAYQTPNTWIYLSSTTSAGGGNGYGACLIRAGDYIYSFRGGSSAFWRYDINNDIWISTTPAPAAVGTGASLIYPENGNYIYAFRGGNTTDFWRYNIQISSWDISISPAPGTMGSGSSSVWVKIGTADYIYTLRGGTNELWRYQISLDSWTRMASRYTFGAGASLIWDRGNLLYAFKGGTSKTFYRYKISENSWTTPGDATSAPDTVGAGGSLVCPSTYTGTDFIFAVRGGGTTDFWRYQISKDSWTSLPPTPDTIGSNTGNRLAYYGDYIYCRRGVNTDSFWRYRWRDNTPPAAVTLSAKPGISEGEIILSWTAPGNDGNDGSVENGKWKIDYSTDSNYSFNLLTYKIEISTAYSPNTTHSYTITGLIPGLTYYFKFWSADDYGNYSQISNLASAKAKSKPQPVSSFQGVSLSTEVILWTWIDNSDNEDGYRLKNSTAGVVADLPANTTSYLESTLIPNTSYFRYVEAYNTAGASSSTAVIKYTLAATPASTAITAVYISSTTFSWSANGNPSGTNYELQFSTTSDFSFINGTTTTTWLLATFYSLFPDTTYYFRLRAYNGDNRPTDYATSISTKTQSLPPDTGYLAGKIFDSYDQAALLNAHIEIIKDNITISSTTTNNFGQYSFILTSGTYRIQVCALGYATTISTINISPAINNFDFLLDDNVPPENVSDFTATPHPSGKGITLTWTNPLDADFRGVKIYYSTITYPTDGILVSTFSSLTTNYFHLNLVPEITYYYIIFTYDKVPNYSTGTKISCFLYIVSLTDDEIKPTEEVTIILRPHPEKKVKIEIPAGSFDTSLGTVTISVERSTSLAQPDQNKQPHLKGSGIGVRLEVKDKTKNLLQPKKPITIILKYTDDEIIGMKEENLALAWYNQDRWEPLPTTVYPQDNKIVAEIIHLSLFQIVERIPAQTVAEVYVYPNPCYLNKNQKPTFTRLPERAKITVYAITGEKTFETLDEDGISYTWNIENLASGIYIFLVEDTLTGKKKTGKIALIR